ncbi:TetR/AcrR family transcriptional regulator [Pseudonocardia xishanensis]|uniref:TetR/AcrR family transcriptional regulator n=1 Tax=Pseudonocardia xishanensis TaxID=630995 RepID=A0ABP8RVQ2_9PSEU
MSKISRRRGTLREANPAYQEKRRELVRLASTVFKEKGYDATTLNDIAERFGTDRAQLYYYVSGKEELFQEAVAGVMDGNLADALEIRQMDIDPAAKLHLLAKGLMRSYQENYPQMYVYLQEFYHKVADNPSEWSQGIARQTGRYQKIVTEVVIAAVREGRFRGDITPPLAVNALFGMLNWTSVWFQPGRHHSADEVAEAFASIFCSGMAAPNSSSS